MMRATINDQLVLGEVNISQISFDPKSRDEIPQLLRGLQYIYCKPELRNSIFKLLEDNIPHSRKKGRRGMELWKILVLGTIRLNCNWDYDKLKEMADNHSTLREMLGITAWVRKPTFNLQTLKDNVSLLTPELLIQVNTLVVGAGHTLVKKKDEEELRVRCDSFVVPTNVHYPTDISLLFDSTRKTLELTARLFTELGRGGYRQHISMKKKCKKRMRKIQKARRSNSKDPVKKQEKDDKLKELHKEYITFSSSLIEKAACDLASFSEAELLELKGEVDKITPYIEYGRLFIDQIERRVLKGEKIPHNEKVFSIFEPHTEWISKGKAGVPQELGLRVCVVTDQYGFTLGHKVMRNETDSDIAVELMKEVKSIFPSIKSVSFDKGFWSPSNKEALEKYFDTVALPKKGKLSKADKEHQYSENFVAAMKGHSAVEAAIGAYDNHGLDKCPDKGIHGYERYVALAVAALSLQHLGAQIIKKEKESAARSEAIKKGLAEKISV